MNFPGNFRIFLFVCLSVFAFSSVSRAVRQDTGGKAETAASLMRPCNAHQAGSKRAGKNKLMKPLAGGNQANIACLEARDSPLNIQEFFQSYVRAQAWRFGEEKIVADGWMFARYLDKSELLQFAKEGRLAGRVNWAEGKAFVLVTTRERNDGFTRVEITARMQGFGQSVDRFAPPKDSWDLESSGLLEKTLITALEDHFKSLESTPAT